MEKNISKLDFLIDSVKYSKTRITRLYLFLDSRIDCGNIGEIEEFRSNFYSICTNEDFNELRNIQFDLYNTKNNYKRFRYELHNIISWILDYKK